MPSTITLPPAGSSLPEYRVRAHNAAVLSENLIHDDTVAQQYGFKGGLVPGVTVYAYMTSPVIRALGLAWLEHGAMSVRLLKPFYEGEEATIRSLVVDSGAAPAIEVTAFNPAGEVCAAGRASLPEEAPTAPDPATFPARPLPEHRRAVSYEVLAATRELGMLDEVFEPETGEARAYLEEIPDDFESYHGPGAVASSGYLIRRANTALAMNVRLNPWIHVSSEVSHFSLLRAGEQFTTRSRVTELFERKGHKFVRLDVLILGGDERPVMRVDHTAIYDVRKVQVPG